MKKVIATLLSIFIMLMFVSGVTYGIEGTIGLEHAIDPVSEFSVKGKNVSKFESTSSIEVATVSLDNNTRDGYKLYLTTTNGVLHSGSSDNGEADIAYTLSKTSSGSQPNTAGFTRLTVPSSPPTTPTLIMGAADALSGAQLLNDATEIDFTLKVAVISASFIDMAGSYNDTITLTYTDN
jgi:hypothetical protein